MIVLDMEQGTDEWLKARSAIPTASMFSSIITSTGKASTSAKAYMNQLLAEYVAGGPVDAWEGNKYTEIGTEREPESRALYSLLTDNEVNEVGFCFKDQTRLVGCSPDGLVGDSGLVEFKNPKASTLIGYKLAKKLPSGYVPQVQGQMWVTGREWCDFMTYHPNIGHFMIHVDRDEKFITTMSGLINKFIEEMLEKRELLMRVKHG
jgi:hypothetical protein